MTLITQADIETAKNKAIKLWFIRPKHTKYKSYFKMKVFHKLIPKKKPKKKYKSQKHIKIFNEYYWDIDRCMQCMWVVWWLQIHHKDKNHDNNEPSNLIKLCGNCHTLEHIWDSIYPLMKKQLLHLITKQCISNTTEPTTSKLIWAT